MKRKYLVLALPEADRQPWQAPGPFVVIARHPAHAARLARHRWPAYLSNHVREETHALAVHAYGDEFSRPFLSDRRGQVIPSAARFHR